MAPGAGYKRALALHRSGDLDEASACYRAVLASEPAHSGALHLLGVIEGQRGRYAEAVALIEQAIGVDANIAAHANLGHARQALGDLVDALLSYQRALALQPTHRIALMGKGRTCRLLGRLTDALSAYEAALDLDPDCHESLMIQRQSGATDPRRRALCRHLADASGSRPDCRGGDRRYVPGAVLRRECPHVAVERQHSAVPALLQARGNSPTAVSTQVRHQGARQAVRPLWKRSDHVDTVDAGRGQHS